MEGTLNQFTNMKFLAEKFVKNQVRRPGDYIGPDGLLYCGTCGEPRQGMMPYPNPSPGDLNRMTNLLVTTACRCEREAEERERRAAQSEKEMKAIQALREASLIEEKYSKATFDAFEVTEYNNRNLKISKRFAEAFGKMEDENRCLLFWGNNSTGKSFTAACIANYLLERRVSVIMTSFVKILELIQSGKETEADIIKRLNGARLLILDDLGTERGSDYTIQIVYNIIDSRVRCEMPMILTTNLTVDQMKKEKDTRYLRIYERIFEVIYPMQFTGPSWRRKEASKRFHEMESFLDEG